MNGKEGKKKPGDETYMSWKAHRLRQTSPKSKTDFLPTLPLRRGEEKEGVKKLIKSCGGG